MPKPVMAEPRFDFRGGRNTNVNVDLLNATELADCTNARAGSDFLGALTKRTGTRRLHQTALGAPSAVKGLIQWDGPAGKQVVAISNGKLYYRNAATGDYGAFTLVTPGTAFSTTSFAHMAPFRASTSGAPLVLYIASGGHYYAWDGAGGLTLLDGTNGAPLAGLLAIYHTRAFCVQPLFPKHLYWSRIGDATYFTTGVSTDGGSALVDVLTGDVILGLETVGGSLLVGTADAVVRFSGYSSNDIQIAQDTQGVSADVGLVGEQAMLRVEQVAALMSTRGPYVASEAGVQSIGFKVEPDFDQADRAYLANICIGHNRTRREIWYAYAAVGDGGLNKHVLVYNYRVQNWYGPFVYPFGIGCMYRFTDLAGSEWFMAGCTDGFVRHMDISGTDDVLWDGSGGSAYTMTVELAPYFFGTGPGYIKALRRVHLQASLLGNTMTVKAATDNAAFVALAPGPILAVSSAVLGYRLDAPSIQGRRVRIQITDTGTTIPIIAGLIVEAYDMQRPALTAGTT